MGHPARRGDLVSDDLNTERATDFEPLSIAKSNTALVHGTFMIALASDGIVTGVRIDRIPS